MADDANDLDSRVGYGNSADDPQKPKKPLVRENPMKETEPRYFDYHYSKTV